jgi:hypothetical protein
MRGCSGRIGLDRLPTRPHLVRRQEFFSDGQGRGAGRLVLIIRALPARVTTAEWNAQQWRDGRRTKSKISAAYSWGLKSEHD